MVNFIIFFKKGGQIKPQTMSQKFFQLEDCRQFAYCNLGYKWNLHLNNMSMTSGRQVTQIIYVKKFKAS